MSLSRRDLFLARFLSSDFAEAAQRELKDLHRKFPVTRRDFLISSTASGVAMTAYGSLEQHWRQKISCRLDSAGWPEDHKDLKIAVAGDFHVGCPAVGLDDLAEIVHDLNAMQADVIVLLGDFLNSVEGYRFSNGEYVDPELIAEVLAGLKAPHGVFTVLGNHDWKNDGKGLRRALERHGITVLENDATKIEISGNPIWLTGIDDDSTGHADLAGTFSQVSGNAPVITLCHDPANFLEIKEYPHVKPVVTLAGHTHGGQIRIPVLGLNTGEPDGRVPYRYFYGNVRENDRDMIVTSGLGTSKIPVRIASLPEIIELTIGSGLA